MVVCTTNNTTNNHFSADQSAHRLEYTYEELLANYHLTLKMTTASIVEMSAINHSPSQDLKHSEGQIALNSVLTARYHENWHEIKEMQICAFAGKVNQRD